MQLEDRSIHKFFASKTLRHTNTSSIKTTIFYIMKTLYNLNNDMHAHDCLFIPCEAYPLFHPYEVYPPFYFYVHTLCFTVQTLYVTTHPQWHNIVRFWLPKPDFPGGHPSWDCSRRSTLNCGILIVHGHHGFKTRCVINSAFIHISTSSFPGDVRRHTILLFFANHAFFKYDNQSTCNFIILLCII
jgi:hypothetical protein